VLLEQNNKAAPVRYVHIEGVAELSPPVIGADPAKLPPLAA